MSYGVRLADLKAPIAQVEGVELELGSVAQRGIWLVSGSRSRFCCGLADRSGLINEKRLFFPVRYYSCVFRLLGHLVAL